MKNPQRAIHVIIVLCIMAFLLTIFEFLALQDIHHEYVSTRVLARLDITLSGDLPDWTSTKGEWGVVRISYLFRFVFFIVCVSVLYKLVSRRESMRDRDSV